MQKVRFLQDFQGKETKEVFYAKGQEVDLLDHVAELLLADRRVELVHDEAPVVFENVTGVETDKLDKEKLARAIVTALAQANEPATDPEPAPTSEPETHAEGGLVPEGALYLIGSSPEPFESQSGELVEPAESEAPDDEPAPATEPEAPAEEPAPEPEAPVEEKKSKRSRK